MVYSGIKAASTTPKEVHGLSLSYRAVFIVENEAHMHHSGTHTPCPCVFYSSRHNFLRYTELKFCILS